MDFALNNPLWLICHKTKLNHCLTAWIPSITDCPNVKPIYLSIYLRLFKTYPIKMFKINVSIYLSKTI